MTSEELRELKMDVAIPVSATPDTTPFGDRAESAPNASIEPPSGQLDSADPATTADEPGLVETDRVGITIALNEGQLIRVLIILLLSSLVRLDVVFLTAILGYKISSHLSHHVYVVSEVKEPSLR